MSDPFYLLSFLQTFESVFYIAEVIIAIGFLIFIHELGHFLLAKLTRVRVEIFSLGFGPKLLGFKKGETEYRVSLVPLGGYVKMSGESPSEKRAAKPYDFSSKPVGIRALIVAAGVVANVLFAFIVFPIIFRFGIPFVTPAIGGVKRGSPAWEAGLRTGDKILSVDGREVYDLEDVFTFVALGDKEKGVELRVLRKEGEKEKTFVQTVKLEEDPRLGLHTIGILPRIENATLLMEGEGIQEKYPAFRAGDRIVAVNGKTLNHPQQVEDIQLGYLQGKQILTLNRSGRLIHVPLVPEKTEETYMGIGITYADSIVGKVIQDSPAEEAGFRPGDIIEKVGKERVFRFVDFLSAVENGPADTPLGVTLHRGPKRLELKLPVEPEKRMRITDGLAPEADTTRILVEEGKPAQKCGLQSGDKILTINGKKVRNWREISETIQKARGASLEIESDREGSLEKRVVHQKEIHRTRFPLPEISSDYPMYPKKEENILAACKTGFRCSINTCMRVLLTLKRILISQTVSPEHIGGIITISVVSYRFAKYGICKLLFFLSLLSINLAILNILPIPILDGGILIFLLVEKIKGSPVSEKVVGYAQIAGLAVIIALLLYVTYNDIARFL